MGVRESNGWARGSGFKLTKCGDTWGTGSFLGAQGHETMEVYTLDPPRKAGRSRHWKPPTPCFPLTHFCLSHMLQDRHSSTHTSRHNQLPHPNLSYTSDAHTCRAQGHPRRDVETHPPRGTQTSTYMQAWAQFHLLHEASAQPLWLGKVGTVGYECRVLGLEA